MRRIMLVLGIVLMIGSLSRAATYYFEGTEDNLWGNLNNWTVDGSMPAVLPGAADDVRIRASCLYDAGTLTIRNLQIGSGGPGDLTMNEGALTTGSGGGLHAIGWDAEGSLTLNGGTITLSGADSTIGCWANKGTVTINGGRLFAPSLLVLAIYDDAGTFVDSKVNLNGGVMESYYFERKGGTVSINNGRLLVWYDDSRVQGYINTGVINGFDGLGTVTFDTVAFPSSATAEHNMHPSPDFYETVLAGDVALTWTNLEPNTPGDDVYVDVWFGTDPNKLGANYTKVVAAGQNTTTVTVNAPAEPGIYYWQVDSYRYGDPGVVGYSNDDPNLYPIDEGTLFEFYTTDDTPPVVNAGVDMITWANEPVQLAPTVTDDGASSLTYAWTADDPNAIFSDPSAEAPTVTVDYAANAVTLTLTVQDEFNALVADTVIMNVYGSACSAAVDGPGLDPVEQSLDLYFDCQINLQDFAVLAAGWLDNYELTAPIPVP